MLTKGTRVRVVINPYAPMLDIPKGTEGVITKSGPSGSLVSVRFKDAPHVGCWLTKTQDGADTLEVLP